jgi:hypothetical protein
MQAMHSHHPHGFNTHSVTFASKMHFIQTTAQSIQANVMPALTEPEYKTVEDYQRSVQDFACDNFSNIAEGIPEAHSTWYDVPSNSTCLWHCMKLDPSLLAIRQAAWNQSHFSFMPFEEAIELFEILSYMIFFKNDLSRIASFLDTWCNLQNFTITPKSNTTWMAKACSLPVRDDAPIDT